jgi:hypothetical protein
MQVSLFYIVYLPYVKLTSYYTRLVQVSNNAKLFMADGAYENL